jgi:YggT family protein
VNILLALTRGDIADYVASLTIVYLILIFIRILLSWIPRVPYNPTLSAVIDFVHQVVDPYLNLFRRFLPPIGGGRMALDISPIIATILLIIVSGIVVGLIRG